MTHTKTRQKFANLAEDPRLALSIADPDDEYRSLEIRGVLESVEDDDAEASFYKGLQHRYGRDYEVTDKDVRVVSDRPADEVHRHRGRRDHRDIQGLSARRWVTVTARTRAPQAPACRPPSAACRSARRTPPVIVSTGLTSAPTTSPI